MRNFESVDILGFPVRNVSLTDFLTAVDDAVRQRTRLQVITANAAMLVAGLSDPELAAIMRDPANVVTADGMSLVFVSKFLGAPIRERLTGVDMVWDILEMAEARGYRVFFLGARAEVIAKTVDAARAKFPRLKVAGMNDGYFQSDAAVCDKIRDSAADILLVGMGFSMQEKWIRSHQDSTGVPVALGVGGSFDVMSGRLKRAPLWMQRYGLEWLYRLKQEKKRLWKRYLVSNTRFLWEVLKMKIRGKKGRA